MPCPSFVPAALRDVCESNKAAIGVMLFASSFAPPPLSFVASGGGTALLAIGSQCNVRNFTRSYAEAAAWSCVVNAIVLECTTIGAIPAGFPFIAPFLQAAAALNGISAKIFFDMADGHAPKISSITALGEVLAGLAGFEVPQMAQLRAALDALPAQAALDRAYADNLGTKIDKARGKHMTRAQKFAEKVYKATAAGNGKTDEQARTKVESVYAELATENTPYDIAKTAFRTKVVAFHHAWTKAGRPLDGTALDTLLHKKIGASANELERAKTAASYRSRGPTIVVRAPPGLAGAFERQEQPQQGGNALILLIAAGAAYAVLS